ncbi:MAG: hypothetical protein EOP11_22025 [Proteobacteria bacterium]|nr:MAG: hypothetical protein EOP11_22025 [Pseudomonadota bacterium]
MKKSLLLQPKDFRQTLHFWMRRPDYGWAALWNGSALSVEPFEDRVELIPGPRPRWRILQVVGGMETSIYLNVKDAPPTLPGEFQVFELPNDSWWRNEGRALLADYLKFGMRNAPSAHALFSFAALAATFIYLVAKDGSGTLAFLTGEQLHKATKVVGALCVSTPLFSLWINRAMPSRTHLTTLFFKAEAWLLLLTALAALPKLPTGLQNFRAQVLQQAGNPGFTEPEAGDQRFPASP